MSQYNTTNPIKNLRHWVMKTNTNEHHNRIVNDLFNALFVEQQEGHAIDHTPNISDIMTLNLNQVQRLMIQRREGDYSQTDIIDALKGLEYPKMILNGVTHTCSDLNDNKRPTIHLDYSQPPIELEKNSCEAALEVWHDMMSRSKSDSEWNPQPAAMPTELKHCQNMVNLWKGKAQYLEEQNTELQKRLKNQRQTIEGLRSKNKEKTFTLKEERAIDQMTIARLRSVITELSEALHAADTNARVSITASEMLDLMHSNHDATDTPF